MGTSAGLFGGGRRGAVAPRVRQAIPAAATVVALPGAEMGMGGSRRRLSRDVNVSASRPRTAGNGQQHVVA